MSRLRYRCLAAAVLGLLAAAPARAQENAMPGMNMPGAKPAPATKKTAAPGAAAAPSRNMPGMNMSGAGGMSMSSSVDLNDPMSQEASGTAWLPSSSPMYGKMFMLKGNMLMLHGAAMPRYTDVGSKRGDRRFDAPNWFMGMFSHPLTSNSQLGLRAMLSAGDAEFRPNHGRRPRLPAAVPGRRNLAP